MTDTCEATGHCLCGKVELSATAVSRKAGACHCDMCKRWAGGPLMTVDCGADVRFSGHEYIGVYDSSAWAERGFCQNCGSHLFYHLKQDGRYILPVGLLDAIDDLVFDHQLFIESKPAYYSFANTTDNLTGEEVFALFAPRQD